MKVTEQVAAFAEPVVQEHGCELWDVEYVREGSEYFLRLYIDKEGGVDIDDCEYQPALYLSRTSIQLPTVKATEAQYSGSSRTSLSAHHS